jgi:opacity protein-like surface antigen
MFSGDVVLQGGEPGAEGIVLPMQSGSVNSDVTTDVISIMAFYDFYDGLYKPMRTAIPYIGFGIGYADSKTVLNLSDPYGDIAYQLDLTPYGEVVNVNGVDMIEFYKSERHTSNVAGLLAGGVSYGINERMFLDFGARLMYVPRIKWGLTNIDDTRHREFFSAKNMIYTNVTLGIRFEF